MLQFAICPEAIIQMLDLSTKTNQQDDCFHLSPEAADALMAALPAKIQTYFENRAEELEFPLWAIIEMYLASAIDPEAQSFLDCKPDRYENEGSLGTAI